MTNREMLNNYYGIIALQNAEGDFFKKHGTHLLAGRIKITYAVNKNKEELLKKLKPYEDTRETLIREYRDLDAEKKRSEELEAERQERLQTDPDAPQVAADEIYRQGKTKEELQKKLDELMDIDVEDVNIHKVQIDQLEDLALASTDLAVLMFMIAE